MKRCPKCNRTFENDKQKFCTQDGTALLGDTSPTKAPPDFELKETIRIDSAGLHVPDMDDDFETKVIPRDAFDPYKTNVSTPQEPPRHDPYKTTVSTPQNTAAGIQVDTSDLRKPVTPPPTADLPRQVSPGETMSTAPSAPVSPPVEPTPAEPPPASTRSRISIPAGATAPEERAQVATATTTPAFAAPQPAKRSKLPLILGILFVLFMVGVGIAGAGYWFVVRPILEKKRAVVEEPRVTAPPTTSTTNTDTGPKKNDVKEAPPYRAPLGAVQFVNSNDNLDGKLKEHYVDFSFYYPEGWQKDPRAGVPGASNFAKVERRLPPDFTQENFAVGWYASAGSAEGDQTVFPTLAANLSGQFAKNFADYKKVSEGPAKVGVYDGYQFRFESRSRDTAKGDIQIWGRVIFLPPVDGGKNGVTLLMLATSLAPELKSVNDVGVKGELPMMLDSFRFGKQ